MTEEVQQNYPELKKLRLDEGYAGECEQWLETVGYEVDITTRNDGLGAWVAEGEEPAPRTPGFVLQKIRWAGARCGRRALTARDRWASLPPREGSGTARRTGG
ncbi:MAG: hypothetical protein HYV63_23765 [Candidatus Schekmanbacteria bacterium]|nr:hypothetical protein [Candidatus Schekmanbacteria bacterium]